MTADLADAYLAVMVRSHRRLVDAIAPMTPQELAGPSYDTEWSIGQVLSHLGSGAEIFSLFLDAGLDGQPAPGVDQFKPVWDRWNAKRPAAQAGDGIAADAAFLDRVESLDGDQRTAWRMDVFGGEQDLAGLLRFRVGEHAVHTWDVVVAVDEAATVAPDAVELLVDMLDGLVARAGKPVGVSMAVEVVTWQPERRFLLRAGAEGASLERLEDAATAPADGVLRLPAEALVRLVYGRLDPRHTPVLEADHVDIDLLRRMFPGF